MKRKQGVAAVLFVTGLIAAAAGASAKPLAGQEVQKAVCLRNGQQVTPGSTYSENKDTANEQICTCVAAENAQASFVCKKRSLTECFADAKWYRNGERRTCDPTHRATCVGGTGFGACVDSTCDTRTFNFDLRLACSYKADGVTKEVCDAGRPLAVAECAKYGLAVANYGGTYAVNHQRPGHPSEYVCGVHVACGGCP